MKKIIVSGAVAAIAAVSFAGNASAALPEPGPGCFGKVHKAVNTHEDVQALLDVENVGDLVQKSEGKGQGKNMTARSVCAS
jgi:hypothetical protein